MTADSVTTCNLIDVLALQYARLYAGDSVRLECVKICLIGDERAGKTTLAKAIQHTFLQYLSSADETAQDTMDISERTVGMTISETTISSIGHAMVCDYAGQEYFHRTHIFFDESNSLYAIVVSGLATQ